MPLPTIVFKLCYQRTQLYNLRYTDRGLVIVMHHNDECPCVCLHLLQTRRQKTDLVASIL